MNTDVPWHLAGIKVTHIAVMITAIDWSVLHRQGQAGTLRLTTTETKKGCRTGSRFNHIWIYKTKPIHFTFSSVLSQVNSE